MFRPTVARLQALIQWVGSTKPADLPLKWQMPVIQVAEAEAKKVIVFSSDTFPASFSADLWV